MNILHILLAIFLPPIAAFFKVGISLQFFVNIVLTLFGIFPGSIHAIWLLVRKT